MKTFKFIKFAFGALALGLLSILALNSTGGTTESEVMVFGTDQVYADVPSGGDGCDGGGGGDCQ